MPLALLALVLAAPAPYVWRTLPLDGGGDVRCLAVSPLTPDLVVCGGSLAGIHRSLDGGLTWAPASAGLRSDADLAIAAMECHPTDAKLIYAATGRCDGRLPGDWGGLFTSADGGVSWSLRSREVRFGGAGEETQGPHLLVTDPFRPDRLWAATAWDGVVLSTDRGATWRKLGPADVFLTSLGRTADGTLYAGAVPARGRPGGLYRLAPGGPAWVRVYEGAVADLAVAASEAGRLLLATPDKGLLRTADGGRTWVNVTPAGFAERLAATTVAFSASHPQVGLAAGAERAFQRRHPNLFITLDGGRSWQPAFERPDEAVHVPVGLWLDAERFGRAAACAAFDPRTPRRLWIGCGDGVWGTHDGAANWFCGARGLRSSVVQQIALDPTTPDTAWLGLAEVGVFRAELRPFAVAPLGGNGVSVTSAPGLLARRGPAGTRVVLARGRALWLQDEMGRWREAAGQAPGELGRLAPLPDGANVAECAGLPLQQTRDVGATWQTWGHPPLVDGRPLALRLPALLDDLGHEAAAIHPERGLFLSHDGGETWAPGGAGLPDLLPGQERSPQLRLLAVLPGREPVVYAATPLSVWRSLDRGETFERVFARPVSALAVERPGGRVIVAAEASWRDRYEPGLLVSDDRGESWQPLPGDWPVHRRIGLIVPDPRVRGRLWVGTLGNGALVGEPVADGG